MHQSLKDHWLTHHRLTEQLWRKVNVYEALLLDFVPELDSAQQSAIQRALLLVSTRSLVIKFEAYICCSLHFHRMAKKMSLRDPRLI